MVYYDSWNSIWKAVFQDGKTLFHAIWCECDRIKEKKVKIGINFCCVLAILSADALSLNANVTVPDSVAEPGVNKWILWW